MFRTIFTTLTALLKSGLCATQLYPRSDTSSYGPPCRRWCNYLLSEQPPSVRHSNVFPSDNVIIRRRKIFGVRRGKETWDGKGRTLLKKNTRTRQESAFHWQFRRVNHNSSYVWRISYLCNMILGCCAIKTTVLSSLVSRLTQQHCRNTSESLRKANCK